MEATWIDGEKTGIDDGDIITSYLNTPAGVLVRTIVWSDFEGHMSVNVVLVPGASVSLADGKVRFDT